LIGLAIFYTLSARDNMVLTLLGAAIVGVILFLVMRHVNQVEED
jgi:type II secretory pathway component PulM